MLRHLDLCSGIGGFAQGIPRVIPPWQDPNRSDRIRALGNAVVPQIPMLIGRAILEVEYG